MGGLLYERRLTFFLPFCEMPKTVVEEWLVAPFKGHLYKTSIKGTRRTVPTIAELIACRNFEYPDGHSENISCEASGKFLTREFALVRKNVNERALCSRLAQHLESAKDRAGLDKYYVDVEYDRHGELRKTLFNTSTGKPENIVCDLLLHSRGEQKLDNLICLEMKKTSGKDKQTDRERLQALTSPNPEGDYPKHVWDYQFGYYLEVDVRVASVLIEEYRGGKLVEAGTASSPSPNVLPLIPVRWERTNRGRKNRHGPRFSNYFPDGPLNEDLPISHLQVSIRIWERFATSGFGTST